MDQAHGKGYGVDEHRNGILVFRKHPKYRQARFIPPTVQAVCHALVSEGIETKGKQGKKF